MNYRWSRSLVLSKVYPWWQGVNPYMGLNDSRQTRSISCLLMTWLLMEPGHQQTWYLLYEIGMFLSSLVVNLNCDISVLVQNANYRILFCQNYSAYKGLRDEMRRALLCMSPRLGYVHNGGRGGGALVLLVQYGFAPSPGSLSCL